jgi:hypothetical protein
MKIKKIYPVSTWALDKKFRRTMKLDRYIIRISNAHYYEEDGYYFADIMFTPIENEASSEYINEVVSIFGVTFDTSFEGSEWRAK